jgi:hypothetical protein
LRAAGRWENIAVLLHGLAIFVFAVARTKAVGQIAAEIEAADRASVVLSRIGPSGPEAQESCGDNKPEDTHDSDPPKPCTVEGYTNPLLLA